MKGVYRSNRTCLENPQEIKSSPNDEETENLSVISQEDLHWETPTERVEGTILEVWHVEMIFQML